MEEAPRPSVSKLQGAVAACVTGASSSALWMEEEEGWRDGGMETAATCLSPAGGGRRSSFPASLLCGEEGNDSSSKKLPVMTWNSSSARVRARTGIFRMQIFQRRTDIEDIHRKPSGIENNVLETINNTKSAQLHLNLQIYIHTCQINDTFNCN